MDLMAWSLVLVFVIGWAAAKIHTRLKYRRTAPF